MSPDPYGADVLAGEDGPRRLADSYPRVSAAPGIPLLHRSSGLRGVVVKFTGELVQLRDARGGTHTFENHPGAFSHRGESVTLVRPTPGPTTVAPRRSAAGGIVAASPTARVARASRLWVEGTHDATLLERVWGDELRELGIVVEPLGGIDDLAAQVRRFGPGPGRRLAVLVDHLVRGTKEHRIAAEVAGPHVVVVGHPHVDVWQCVRPRSLGIDAWPEVPRGEDWKTGVCARLGWGAPREGWRHVLAAVDSYADLEPSLVGAVETALDELAPPEAGEDG